MCYHDTILFERQYEAAPEQVFNIWADPVARARWGAPSKETAIEYFEADFRIGGRDTSRCGPLDDLRYHVDVVYIDIIDNEQIIMSETIMDDEKRLSVSLITVNFKEDNFGTKLEMIIQISSMIGKDMIEGCRMGWDAALSNLKGEFVNYGKFKKEA